MSLRSIAYCWRIYSNSGLRHVVEIGGIEMTRVLKWVDHADLCRINVVAGQYSGLLEAAGVDSVPELAQRSAANLVQQMVEVNDAKKLVRALPAGHQMADWVEQAKSLPKVVPH